MARELSTRVIELAKEYLGKTESKIKANYAPWLDDLMKLSGNPAKWRASEAYCIAALCALFKIAADELNVKFPIRYSKGSQAFFLNAIEETMVTQTPSVGDIVIFRVGKTGRGHAGLVISIQPNGIGTIEFNTGGTMSGPQRNGDGCYAKFRRFADFTKTDKLKLWIRGYVTTSQL